jgi:hypothetical protein
MYIGTVTDGLFTEVLTNDRHIIKFINLILGRVRSSEEQHIAVCPCPSKMGVACHINTWLVVFYCHILNGKQLVQFGDLPMKLSKASQCGTDLNILTQV